MSGKPVLYLESKGNHQLLGSAVSSDQEKTCVKVCDKEGGKQVWNYKRGSCQFLPLITLVVIVGCMVLVIMTFSTLRRLQSRIDILERRLEYLEKIDGYDAYLPDTYQADKMSNVLSDVSAEDYHIRSISTQTYDDNPSAGALGRRKRTAIIRKRRRRSTIKPRQEECVPKMAAIHMEMTDEVQRRRRNPSAENPNVIGNWKISDWVPPQSRENFIFPDTHGSNIVVKQKGLYFVYSQILFHNLAPRNIFSIKINNQEFVRCYKSVDYAQDNVTKYKSCYTGVVALIESNQSVTIHDLYNHGIDPDKHSNFFGLIKLADIP